MLRPYIIICSGMNEYGVLVEWYWEEKAVVLEEKHVPVPLCPSQ
jgi:hypothetical protein